LVRFLWLDIKDPRARLIYSRTLSLFAHERDDGGLVHEAEFSLEPVLFRIRVIDNGRIHEHAAVRKDPVEISSQGTEVPEGIFPLVLLDPILNPFSECVSVGYVE